YRDRGDQVFAGGVLKAFLGSGKQFDQNYAWSFDYVKWRGGGAQPLPTGTLRVAITEPTNGTTVSGTAWAVVWINGATGSANSVVSASLSSRKRDGPNDASTSSHAISRADGGQPPPPGTLRIAITEPTNGTTVSGTAWAVVWINGATGSANSVTLTLGGRTVGSTTSGSAGPISLPFDTKLAADGTQTLTASARDASGNTGAGSVSVTVSN